MKNLQTELLTLNKRAQGCSGFLQVVPSSEPILGQQVMSWWLKYQLPFRKVHAGWGHSSTSHPSKCRVVIICQKCGSTSIGHHISRDPILSWAPPSLLFLS
jgi:hypothetical protein